MAGGGWRGAGATLAAARGLLPAPASPAAEHRLWGVRASVAAPPGLWGTGLIVWHMGLVAPQHVGSSGSGFERVSPALAGRFFTAEPAGKAPASLFLRKRARDLLRRM